MIQQMIQFAAGNDAGIPDLAGSTNLRTEQKDGQDTRFRDELEASMKKHSEREDFKKQDEIRQDLIKQEREDLQNKDRLNQERYDREEATRKRIDQDRNDRERVYFSSKKSESHSAGNHKHDNITESREREIAQSQNRETKKSVDQNNDKELSNDVAVDQVKKDGDKPALQENNLKKSKSKNKFAAALQAKLSKKDNPEVSSTKSGDIFDSTKLEDEIKTLRFSRSDENKDSLIQNAPFNIDDKNSSDLMEDLKGEKLALNLDKQGLLKNKKNKDNKPIVSVDDQRTQKKNSSIVNEKVVSLNRGEATLADKNILNAKAQRDPSNVLSQMEATTKESGEKSAVKEMAFYLKDDSFSSEGGVGNNKAPVTKEAEVALRNFLQDQGNADIAKNIKFILKDNQQGVIRLILKPEALGKVKINLRMAENGIKGLIIVENNNTGEIFKENIDRLNALLKEAGFESSQLDVSVGDGNENAGSEKDGRDHPFFSERLKEVDDFVLNINKVGNEAGHLDLVI